MAIFKGAGVAMVTPMKENEDINFEKIEELVEFHINNGTDAIIVCGTTGEPSTQSVEEHMEAVGCAVAAAKKRIPIIAGCGSNNTRTAEETSTTSQKLGADGLLMVTPYYNKCTQKGLIEHYTMIAQSVSLPIIMYNIPGRTGGLLIQPETVVHLCKTVPNIVGVKDATGNISEVAQLAALAKGTVDIYSGNDDQVVPIMSLGGKGVISVLSNVAPKETHEMCAAFLSGDIEKSRQIQLDAIPLINALFCEVNPIPVKKGMQLLGIDTGVLRRPLTEMEPEHAARLKAEMEAFGIL